MADDKSFNQWLQRQHGIGALLLPLIVIVVLVLVVMRQRDEPAPPFANDAVFQDYPLDPKNYSGPDPKPESGTPTEQPATTPPATTSEVPRLEESPPPRPVPGRGVPIDPERPMQDQGQPGPPGEIE